MDISKRRIPNILCLFTAVLGLACAYNLPASNGSFWVYPAHGLIALVVGMALFAMRWIGGGDAKFYAAVACWFPLKVGVPLFLCVTISGLILLIVFFVWRRLKGLPVRSRDGASLPYGVAIASGALTLLMSSWLA